ncbi:MAG: PIN domain-containing protein [Cellulomonas sp.]|jgi:toxin-antitoxin system PIN domain toxin|nr:PIN domain-containing protein [Cellulomonas sp.]
MTVLLDANVLVALSVDDHVHHAAVTAWLDGLDEPYATCPVVQGALVRFALREGASADEALRLLVGLHADPHHEFWPDDLPYSAVRMSGVFGHRQVTDAYLAQAARTRGARLATLDQGLAALHVDVATLIPA